MLLIYPFFESQSEGMAPSWYEIKRGANQDVHLSPSSTASPCCSASHTSNGSAAWGQTLSSADGGPLGNNTHAMGARVLFPPEMERSIQEQIQHFQQKLHHFQQHPTNRSTNNFNYSATTPPTVTTPHDYTPLSQHPSSKMASYPSWQFLSSSSTPLIKREHSSGQANELNPSSSSIGEIFPSAVTLDPLTKLEYYPTFVPYPPDDDFNIPIPSVDCGSTQAIPSSATVTTPSLMESLATPGTNLELFSDIQDFPTSTGMQFNLGDYLGDAALAPPSSLHSSLHSQLSSYKRSRV